MIVHCRRSGVFLFVLGAEQRVRFGNHHVLSRWSAVVNPL